MPTLRRLAPLAAAAAAALALSPPLAAQHQQVRTLRQELLPGDATQVHVNLSFGSLTVEGTRGKTVEVELALDCSRVDLEVCKTRAERIRLAPRMKKGELRVKLKNTPRGRLRGIRARMTVKMPSHVPLEVDVRGGGVYVTGLVSHVNVNSGGGDVDVLHQRDKTAVVDVDVGFGQADLWLGDGRVQGTGWPKSITWQGSGSARIDVAVVGAGDVSIRLE